MKRANERKDLRRSSLTSFFPINSAAELSLVCAARRTCQERTFVEASLAARPFSG